MVDESISSSDVYGNGLEGREVEKIEAYKAACIVYQYVYGNRLSPSHLRVPGVCAGL
jgi:hypothetical protein